MDMIVLSNCLTNSADEGSLTVAVNLVRHIKAAAQEATVVASDPGFKGSDLCLPMNKLMLNGQLIKLIFNRKEPVLHVPAPTRSLPAAVRMFLMSLYARRGLYVVISMHYPVGRIAKWLMRMSRAKIITLSKQAWQEYHQAVGDQAVYVKMGVDTRRFHPVTAQEKAVLRDKYHLPKDKPIVLHVGHLKADRNVGKLLSLDEGFHAVLIVSTQTASEQDLELRRQLQEKSNVTLIDTYVPHIEEYYQLADLYLFPVEKEGHCIDVPISALEAAASGLPVAGTPYGELAQLIGRDGFEQIRSFEPDRLNAQLRDMLVSGQGARESALEYDWAAAAERLLTDVIRTRNPAYAE